MPRRSRTTEAPQHFARRTPHLRDNRAGAAELLARAAEVFAGLPAGAGTEDVLALCAAVAEAQPDMAPLANLAAAVAGAVRDAGADDAAGVAAEAARAYHERVQRAIESVISHTAALVGEGATVLTHSRSSTVEAALLAARQSGRDFRVIATEGRPMYEGRTLASRLAGAGARVTLVADAAVGLMMERADLVLLGADRVTPTALVNKVGTRLVALAAREHNVPVYAACDRSKFTADEARSEPERPPGELWPDAPAGVEVWNRYFEPTPLGLFTAIITEDGDA